MNIRTILASAAALALFTSLGACAGVSPTSVKPGDGPAATAAPTTEAPTEEPTEEELPLDEEEPTEEPTDESVATFSDKYTYEDGVEVEVTKIEHGKITRADSEYSEPEAGAGDAWVMLTTRVKNGSKEKLDAYGSFTLTYGADGDEAEQPYLASRSSKDTDLTGKILPGRSKVATETFAIPTKYQGATDAPVLEFSFDYDHEAAIFSGSLK